MSRIIDCPCGHLLRAGDDDGLLRAAREHIARDHPEMRRTEAQLRQTIRERARDEVAITP